MGERAVVLTSRQWLLYLLAEEDPEVVVYGCQIMARLLVTQPLAYCNKFAAKTGGFAIMAHRLKPWWDIRTLWPILFSILFGYDVAKIDFDRPFEFFSLYEIFSKSQIRTAAVVPVITAMLQHGLRDMLKYQDDPASPSADNSFLPKGSTGAPEMGHSRSRARSMELGKALEPRSKQPARLLSLVQLAAGDSSVVSAHTGAQEPRSRTGKGSTVTRPTSKLSSSSWPTCRPTRRAFGTLPFRPTTCGCCSVCSTRSLSAPIRCPPRRSSRPRTRS